MNKTKNKIKKDNDWLIVAIFVLICALAWVGTNTYHRYVNKKEVVAQKDLLTPLEAEIDQAVFDVLETKTYLEEEKLVEILSGSDIGLTTPTPAPVELPAEEDFPPIPPEEVEIP
jgi:hypothetical protein